MFSLTVSGVMFAMLGLTLVVPEVTLAVLEMMLAVKIEKDDSGSSPGESGKTIVAAVQVRCKSGFLSHFVNFS